MVTVQGREVMFRFFRPGAHEVSVAGDFNGWRAGEMPMHSDGDGWWQVRMRLLPGTYRFRYVADGAWYTDFAAFGIEYTGHGPVGRLHVPPVKVPLCQACETRTEEAAVLSAG